MDLRNKATFLKLFGTFLLAGLLAVWGLKSDRIEGEISTSTRSGAVESAAPSLPPQTEIAPDTAIGPIADATTAIDEPGADALSPAPLSSPEFLTRDFLEASLAALKTNGSDLSLPMPSKHLVRCESRQRADAIADWGRENGFEAASITVFLGHGGVEFFDVELRRVAVPEPDRIRYEGLLIHEHVSAHEDAVYVTWVGEIVAG